VPGYLLDEIDKYSADENFAAGFLPEFGTRKRLNLLAASGAEGQNSKYYNRFMGYLGTMLAAGTDKGTLSEAYLEGLTEPLDTHDDIGGHWAWTLTQYIGATDHRFGTGFLDDVSDKMWSFQTDKDADYRLSDAFDGKSAIDEQYAGDPFGSLFHAMGKNADAAQNFFSDTKRIDYFGDDANDNAWYSSDNGVELGKALKAATTTYLDGDKGEESAEIMKHFIENFANHKDADWLSGHGLGGVRKSLTDMLVTYAHSINDTFYPRDSTGKYLGSDVDPAVMKSYLGTSEWSVVFDQDGLMNAMRDVCVDDHTYDTLSTAVMTDARDVLERDMYDATSWANAEDAAQEGLQRMGHGLGSVFAARQGSLLDDAAHQDKANKIIGNIVGEGVGEIPDGGISDRVYTYVVQDLIFPTDHKDHAIDAGLDQRDRATGDAIKTISLDQFEERLNELRGREADAPADTLQSDMDQWKDTFGSAFRDSSVHNWK
jgi:hypothetical protein